MKQFHAFRDERPKEEKWELIDGVPMMMPTADADAPAIAPNLEDTAQRAAPDGQA